MNQHKILYIADIHGNETQYQKLVNHAIEISDRAKRAGADKVVLKLFESEGMMGMVDGLVGENL